MPVLSGDEVATQIKSMAPTRPVIMLTGFGKLMEAAGEKPWGVDLVLGKPVTMAGLRAGLARAFPPECAENLRETTAL